MREEHMPRVFLSVFADSHEAAIEFYCHTIGLFAVAVNRQITPTVRNVILNYTGATIPLSLAIVVKNENGTTAPVRRPFELELYHPNIEVARDSLVASGYVVEMRHVPLGTELSTIDPFGNRLYLTDKTYESYGHED
jgi:hypothetical protein